MTLAALVLAGGKSRRMGQDKALLMLAGQPLIWHVWNTAQAVTPAVWVVTPRIEQYRAYLPETAQWISEVPPPPTAPAPGPLVAFAEALAQLKADWILLLPCDLPALRAEVLNQWQQHLSTLPSEILAYVPRTPNGWEPLCGFYRQTSLLSVQAYIAAGGRSFQNWLDQIPVQPIPCVPAEMLANCNTPEDWIAYLQHH